MSVQVEYSPQELQEQVAWLFVLGRVAAAVVVVAVEVEELEEDDEDEAVEEEEEEAEVVEETDVVVEAVVLVDVSESKGMFFMLLFLFRTYRLMCRILSERSLR